MNIFKPTVKKILLAVILAVVFAFMVIAIQYADTIPIIIQMLFYPNKGELPLNPCGQDHLGKLCRLNADNLYTDRITSGQEVLVYSILLLVISYISSCLILSHLGNKKTKAAKKKNSTFYNTGSKKKFILGASVILFFMIVVLTSTITITSHRDNTSQQNYQHLRQHDQRCTQYPTPSTRVEGTELSATNAALEKIQKNIEEYYALPNPKYSFGSYVDSATGRIVLQTDAPAKVVEKLTDLSGAPESEIQAVCNMQVQHGTIHLN